MSDGKLVLRGRWGGKNIEVIHALQAENARLRQTMSAIEIAVRILLAAKVHDERYHALVQAELAQIKREAERALKAEGDL